MPLKTPAFWFQKRGILSTFLTPVSWVYQIGHNINQKKQNNPYQSTLPVICIGNAIAGGSGKTPTVIALAKLLKDLNPVILTRGYGGNIAEAIRVNADKHSANEVGDEALLIAKHFPVIVSQNRAEGAKLAEESAFNLIIMDDGLQNNSLAKTMSFLVVDRKLDFGNNKMIPAGPLREPIANILDKSNAIVCIGSPFHADLPVFEASINPSGDFDSSKKYIAFAGIGIPDKFKNTLLDLNANLVGWHTFADHHPYSQKEIEKLQQEAESKNSTLITTEKDYVRIPANLRENIVTLPIELEFSAPEALAELIRNKISLESQYSQRREALPS